MEVTVAKPQEIDELTLLKLSREIAKDIHPIETILERFEISPILWAEISEMPHFNALLKSEREAWHSASNTQDRLQLKSFSLIEEALPEFYERVHDPREPLIAKVRALEVIGKFAGIGARNDGGGGGDGVRVTINLGSDKQITFEKDITPQVIEGDIDG